MNSNKFLGQTVILGSILCLIGTLFHVEVSAIVCSLIIGSFIGTYFIFASVEQKNLHRAKIISLSLIIAILLGAGITLMFLTCISAMF